MDTPAAAASRAASAVLPVVAAPSLRTTTRRAEPAGKSARLRRSASARSVFSRPGCEANGGRSLAESKRRSGCSTSALAPKRTTAARSSGPMSSIASRTNASAAAALSRLIESEASTRKTTVRSSTARTSCVPARLRMSRARMSSRRASPSQPERGRGRAAVRRRWAGQTNQATAGKASRSNSAAGVVKLIGIIARFPILSQ